MRSKDFMINMFHKLYDTYIDNVKRLLFACDYSFVTVAIGAIDMYNYIISTAGYYFVLYNNNGKTVYPECDRHNIFPIIEDGSLKSTHEVIKIDLDSIHVPVHLSGYLDDDPFNITTSNKDKILEIMGDLETEIIRLLYLFPDYIIDNLHKFSDFYASDITDCTFKSLYGRIQFSTIDGKVRHYTTLRANDKKYNPRMLYSCFCDVVYNIINCGVIPYRCLNGLESDVTNLFEIRNEDKSEWWKDNVWTPNSMAVSLLENGAYLPFSYEQYDDNNILLTDGIHRYEALKEINKDKIQLHILAIDTGGEYHEETFYNAIVIKLPDIFYERCHPILKDGLKRLGPIGDDGISIFSVRNTTHLLYAYTLLNRELNNFIDDGCMEDTKPSVIINYRE